MIYGDIVNAYGGSADFLTNETVIDSYTVEENINGDGKCNISWKSTSGGVIPIGTSVNANGHDYIMMNTYAPSLNDDGTYSYSPSFTHRDNLASKTLYVLNVARDAENNPVPLYTFPFTGPARNIISDFSAWASHYNWAVVVGTSINQDDIITVSFDGDSIKSAAEKIASALNTNSYFVNGKICIGTSNAYSAEAYYNYFVVLGGTRNMAKKTLSGSFAQVTQRLTLPDSYPGSVIDVSGLYEPKIMKLLVFDDIYPKQELVISNVCTRLCFMMDESGQKVIDHYEKDGQIVPAGTEGATEIPKYYTKWYVLFAKSSADGVWTDYDVPTSHVIQGQPLGILFQSGYLTGREFDIAVIEPGEREKMDDDVRPEGFTPPHGYEDATWYRIIMVADGSTLIPSTETEGIIPHIGDRVTLLNVKFDDAYKEKARNELLTRANSAIKMYHTPKAEQYQESVRWGDFMTGGGSGSVPALGAAVGGADGYIVTAIQTDILNGTSTITYGTFKQKGILSSMADKIDGVSLSGGQATVGAVTEDDTRKTAPVGIDQYNALRSAGGALGMIPVNKRIEALDGKIDTYGNDAEEIAAQLDKMFNIWFVSHTPLPNVSYDIVSPVPTGSNPSALGWYERTSDYTYIASTDTTALSNKTYYTRTLNTSTANAPANEWETDADKELHEGDICYDMSREAASPGGRAWRWMKVDGVYMWVEITDADTIASLQKIADAASDGILSAGTEKARILGEWRQALHEYITYSDAANTYGSEIGQVVTDMRDAFVALSTMLNGGEPMTGYGDGAPVPAFIANLGEDTLLGDYGITPETYRNKWDDWYLKLTVVINAVTGNVNDVARSKVQYFVSDTVPTGYKEGDMWRKDGVTYICISIAHKDDSSAQNRMQDWSDVSSGENLFPSITNLLSEATILIEPYISNTIKTRDVRMFLSQSSPSATSGDLLFDGQHFQMYDGVTWIERNIPDLNGILGQIVSIIGYGNTITFRRSKGTANLYDVYFRKASFYDKVTDSTIEGGLGIWIYGRNGWEHIIDDTTGLLENYGDHIVGVVFGSEQGGSNSYASGFTTTKNFAEVFSSATDAETGKQTALAAISTIIEKGNNGKPTGHVKIDADNVDFNSHVVTFRKRGESDGPFVNVGFGETTIQLYKRTETVTTAYMSIGVGNTEFLKLSIRPDVQSGTWKSFVKITQGSLETDECVAKGFVFADSNTGTGGTETYSGISDTFVDANGNQFNIQGGIITRKN